MCTIQEYWQCVEHRENDCSVCSIVDNGGVYRPSGRLWGVLSVIKRNNVDLVVYLILMLLATYIAAIHFLYDIVGGIK